MKVRYGRKGRKRAKKHQLVSREDFTEKWTNKYAQGVDKAHSERKKTKWIAGASGLGAPLPESRGESVLVEERERIY